MTLDRQSVSVVTQFLHLWFEKDAMVYICL